MAALPRRPPVRPSPAPHAARPAAQGVRAADGGAWPAGGGGGARHAQPPAAVHAQADGARRTRLHRVHHEQRARQAPLQHDRHHVRALLAAAALDGPGEWGRGGRGAGGEGGEGG